MGCILPNNHKISSELFGKIIIAFFYKKRHLKRPAEIWNKKPPVTVPQLRQEVKQEDCIPNLLGLVDKTKVNGAEFSKVCIITLTNCWWKCRLVLSMEDNLLTFLMEDNSPNIWKLNMYAPFRPVIPLPGFEPIKVYHIQKY